MCALADTPPAESGVIHSVARPETRGVTINLSSNISPTWLGLEIERIARAGFNLLVFPVYNNGWTLYPSEAARSVGMQPINTVFRKWDPLATAVELAHVAGLTVWGFLRPYTFHPRYSIAEHKLLRRHPEWRMRAHPGHGSAETRRIESWNPCPINPDYRRYLGDLVAEATSRYPLDGLVVDFTNFPLRQGSLEAAPFCFCARCRERYYQQTNVDLLSIVGEGHLDAVRQWQTTAIHDNVLYLRYRLRRSRGGIRFVGRVRPFWREYERSRGFEGEDIPLIDWGTLLAQYGLEQLIADHDGEPCGPTLRWRLAADYAYLGDRAAFMPMLSVRDPRELSEAMAAIRRYPMSGCLVEFQKTLSDEGADWLRGEVFSNPAQPPENDLPAAAGWLLERVQDHYLHDPMLHDLMHDFLRLLVRDPILHDQFRSREVIAENILGLEQYLRRARPGVAPPPPHVMRNLALARRYIQMACLDVPT